MMIGAIMMRGILAQGNRAATCWARAVRLRNKTHCSRFTDADVPRFMRGIQLRSGYRGLAAVRQDQCHNQETLRFALGDTFGLRCGLRDSPSL